MSVGFYPHLLPSAPPKHTTIFWESTNVVRKSCTRPDITLLSTKSSVLFIMHILCGANARALFCRTAYQAISSPSYAAAGSVPLAIMLLALNGKIQLSDILATTLQTLSLTINYPGASCSAFLTVTTRNPA
mmetsp:Transcript_5797/g.18120  ORF Transcript_5797/g.18120 Transcript_5797/m.18120 type:complete len:131 (+) Transcript_5797:1191-1583(+)